MTTNIFDLHPDDPRLDAAWTVMAELRPDRDPATMTAMYAEMHPDGYRITAVFDGEFCRAVAGWRLGMNLHLGKYLYVDDLVTAASSRSAGHGGALLSHLRTVARDAGCEVLHLDSGVHRHDAHRFYFREGMHISSHHFLQRL